MRTLKSLVLAPALLVAFACSKDKPADSALNNDLSLAAQAQPGTRLDSISAAERMNGVAPANGYAAPAPVAVAPAPAPRRTTTASAPVRHRTSTSRSSSSGSGGSRVVYSEPRTVTVKNTKRDAVIGAAAGAAIGAATGRSVKSGVIGAAVGGILGGVIGNNVDVHKKPAP